MSPLPQKTDDAAARQNSAPASTGYIRPRDAASLIIIDRAGSEPRLLMGRRARAMHFMPDKFVFPGGATEAQDRKVKAANQLRSQDTVKLLAGMGTRPSTGRAHALAMAAIRETYEETGFILGTPHRAPERHPWQGFAQCNSFPDLSRLRYVARAVTPPGHVRRYDARFFASFLDEIIAPASQCPTNTIGRNTSESFLYTEPELTDLNFVSFSEALDLNIAQITRIILLDIQKLLSEDPDLSSIYPVPLYVQRHGRHVREVV